MKTFKLEKETKIKTGFTVPEKYFEDFSAKMMQQLSEQKPQVISIFARRKTWIYSAAAVLVLALTIPVYQTLTKSLSENEVTTLENYIAYHTSVSGVDLAYLLDEEDIQKLNIDLNIEDQILENELSTNNNLEQYLIN